MLIALNLLCAALGDDKIIASMNASVAVLMAGTIAIIRWK